VIWEPGELPILSEWYDDGPELPIEFARVSENRRLTLVITPGARSLPVLWAGLRVLSLDDAAERLRVREGRTRSQWIGRWPHRAWEKDAAGRDIAAWAREHKLEGVVWTALPPKFSDEVGRVPTMTEAISYLNSLTGEDRHRAGFEARVVALDNAELCALAEVAE
jgi:hypothetical protein